MVSIPDFVRKEMVRIDLLSRPREYNIFSGTVKPFNECYFSLQWSRIRPSLVEEVGITDDHTLYSIRATAAVEVYKKTKDAYKLHYHIRTTNFRPPL